MDEVVGGKSWQAGDRYSKFKRALYCRGVLHMPSPCG